jgi:5-methylthioadenosine/S-adenosylhomocysteine deaminase
VSIADAIRHTGGAVRLRARWVLPVHMPPIEDGEVVIDDGVIESVGKARGSAAGAIDLGLSAILPGLVNAHAHLEYTVLRGMLEDVAFFPWIRALVQLKMRLGLDDWAASASLGAAEMLAAGITTVADASDSGAAVSALAASGQRGTVFREAFGIDRETVVENVVSATKAKLRAMDDQIERLRVMDRVGVGLSPHAPYTVNAELFGALAGLANARGLRQMVHVAESPAEDDLIRRNEGPFAEMFTARAIPWAAHGVSPARYVADRGGFDAPTVAVHCVHLDPEDVTLLKEKGVAVAHCPKSNGKLGAGVAPVRALLDAGVPVGLGTDSVVSNNAADLFDEMRHAVYQARAGGRDAEALTAREALRMATLGGAEALGLADQVGSLERGKRADLCVVRLDGLHLTPTADDSPLAALVYAARASDVALTMVDGRVLYENGRYSLIDVARLRPAVAHARARLRKEAGPVLEAASQFRA